MCSILANLPGDLDTTLRIILVMTSVLHLFREESLRMKALLHLHTTNRRTPPVVEVACDVPRLR